ncbi:MAG: RnfABCDGE type electron transport complex subunit G [Treponema sp.]|jgi:electron transport complex protein RnfG|nr:RnfABCDGE type electron transport complex subunit G [Treponema sp.]
MKHIIKPALALFIITASVTALLGIARNLTLEPIENQRRKTQEKTMREVLPQASAFREIDTEKSGSIVSIYEGRRGNEFAGFVIELMPSGYSGTINLMVGISAEEKNISGMRILKHSETPGLGANAVKEKFYRRFDGKNLVPLRVVKVPTGSADEIEAITASTITTKAVTDAVNQAIEWYLQYGAGESK